MSAFSRFGAVVSSEILRLAHLLPHSLDSGLALQAWRRHKSRHGATYAQSALLHVQFPLFEHSNLLTGCLKLVFPRRDYKQTISPKEPRGTKPLIVDDEL